MDTIWSLSATMNADSLRPQYHFRESEQGLLAWDVRRLVELSQDLPVTQVGIDEIRELDQNHWFTHRAPTCRDIVEHACLIDAADLSYPIILDAEGALMDGMHRVCKALRDNVPTVPSVRFEVTPAPDHIGRSPESLPYE